MPLFLRHRLLFIHVPKCGGDTVTSLLRAHHDPPFLFVADGSVLVNGHTPQHMTWRELRQAGWTHDAAFRVCALVRHPVDRVLSAFRYIHAFRPDLRPLASTPSAFLDAFLSTDPALTARFDQHNRSIHAFLQDDAGAIDPAIEIWRLDQMDQFMGSLGLPPVPPGARRNVTRPLTAEQDSMVFDDLDRQRVERHYAQDIDWYERTCSGRPEDAR